MLAATELGSKPNKPLALAQDLNLFTCLLAQAWKNLHQAQAYPWDTLASSPGGGSNSTTLSPTSWR